jgi:glycosyltransferase 2 family protein
MISKKRLQAMLGLAISAVLIVWMYFAIEWHAVLAELSRVNYFALLPVSAALGAHLFFRSLRWKYLLPDNDAPLSRLFDAIMVGTLATFVLPLRAGEFMRPYMLSIGSKLSFSSCFVSVVIERFFDLSIVLISFALMLGFIDNIPSIANQGALSLSVLAFAIFVFMLVGGFVPDLVLRITERCLRWLPAGLRTVVMSFLKDFLLGAAVLRRPKNLIYVSVLSVLVWLTCFLQYYFFLFMFQIEPSFWMGVSVAVMIALAVAAPSAPGFVGVYQAGCLAAFVLFGVSKELAMAYAIISHVYQFIVGVGLGALALLKNNLKLSELRTPSANPS